MALTNKLSAIGDAIRNKTGKSALLTLDQMPREIESIETGEKEKVLTKLGEYTIQEPVQIFNITPTEEMQKCNFLYVNLINIQPTAQDWIYPRVNTTGTGYTPKVSEVNGYYILVKTQLYSNNIFLATLKGSLNLTNWAIQVNGQLKTFGVMTYETGNTLKSGKVEVWGYV